MKYLLILIATASAALAGSIQPTAETQARRVIADYATAVSAAGGPNVLTNGGSISIQRTMGGVFSTVGAEGVQDAWFGESARNVGTGTTVLPIMGRNAGTMVNSGLSWDSTGIVNTGSNSYLSVTVPTFQYFQWILLVRGTTTSGDSNLDEGLIGWPSGSPGSNIPKLKHSAGFGSGFGTAAFSGSSGSVTRTAISGTTWGVYAGGSSSSNARMLGVNTGVSGNSGIAFSTNSSVETPIFNSQIGATQTFKGSIKFVLYLKADIPSATYNVDLYYLIRRQIGAGLSLPASQ